MSASEPQAAPQDNSLAQYGRTAIVVPLIIGGAIIVAVILLWHEHNKKLRLSEAAQIEEAARQELRSAYVEMRALRPQMALERSDEAKKLLAQLPASLKADYANLKVAQLLVEAESQFMIDCGKYAADAEEKFDEALALMTYASGEMWQFGMLGRARARYEQGKNEETVSDLNTLVERNPSFGSAYYWRSLAQKNLENFEDAKKDELRAKALDSWPPLRDFMQASCVWSRDILCTPELRSAEAPGLTGFFAAEVEERDEGK